MIGTGSKHAVVALSEALYFELGKSKVNVSSSKQLSAEAKARLSEFVKGGLSIDESANFVFDGLRANNLYIGPQAFRHAKKDYLELIRNRAENIINERNPE